MPTTTKHGLCPSCRNNKTLVLSNNPLVPSYCEDCLGAMANPLNMKSVAFWARTYNIPLLPDKWMKMANKLGKGAFAAYVDVVANEFPDTQYNNALKLHDYWNDIDQEWQKVQTHQDAIRQLSAIKDEFLVQMQIKWGMRFTFEEFLQLENLYTNTLRATGITDPLKKDMIKKIAIISVDVERLLAEGLIKDAKDYVAMHKTYSSSVGLDDLVELTDGEVISTVSELAEYLEDNNFQFKYYDGVTRDIVDKTIEDQQEWYRNFFQNATGIQATYELIEKGYKNKLELEQQGKAEASASIEDLIESIKRGDNDALDNELASAELDDNFLDSLED